MEETKKVFISEDTYLTINVEHYKKVKDTIVIEDANKETDIKCRVLRLKDCYIAIPENLVL